ncbi:CDP-glycerol glycerophosphotransferase [Flavobacterium sp. NST-5]|uniref:CDP-glycerol glycerophosphotransferase n=1 Tax=Flavobacterium ichthyis TaxID=2698827 RepID=A0ABW9ZBW1_9FLAO|nr:CDP-glycerol glycerophosphotransferase family protein [Flavobacterium ichthyis]NBL65269.1 CDP-glycerol glycerophosphotransferase [Flavobacterium ichthyis]
MYKFLIYISHPYSIPIGKPLQMEIEKRGYQVFWFSELEYTKDYFVGDEKILNSVEEVLNYQPHIVLTATDSVADFFSGIKVQIFHGFSANKRPLMSDHFKIRGFFDLYTTQGPSTTEIFQQQAKKYGFFEVVETGWSKVDPLFPIEKKSETEKPIILISSTFTTRLSLAKIDEVYTEIKRLSLTGKYQFLCVLHPKLDPETKAKFQDLEGEFFQYFDTTDLVPLYKKADMMLSDTTSAIIEFLLQEKPVVTFRTNKPDEHLIDVTEVSEIENAIALALTKPEKTMTAIRDYITWTHPYHDGKSSGRVIDAAINFLNKDKSHLKSKPLNLIRKWKMRKRLKYFTLKSYNKPITLKL